MKIAVSSEGPDLKAKVGHRLGLSPYHLLIDLESGEIMEVIPHPGDFRSRGGMYVVALIIARKCGALLTGYCSPMAEEYLSAHGVEVVTGLGGTVTESLAHYKREKLKAEKEKIGETEPRRSRIDRKIVDDAVWNTLRQIRNLLPVMVSVVFLAGLFTSFMTRESLTSLFSGNMWLDSLWGALMGSLLAGNPINSYIIGGQLLEIGVSLFAVTAFLCSWVTVGFLQMPAESAALGLRFAAVRNLSCLGLSIVIAVVMTFILGIFGV